jgi:hypothetical protein
MPIPAKLRDEIRSLGLSTLFFCTWFLVLLLLKWLVLAEYRIQIGSLWIALVGALIVAKVVLVLENVPLEALTRNRPAAVDVTARTGLYGLGILVVLILERGFEARHEYGGFGQAVVQLFRQQDIHHILATTIGVTGALLVFNASYVVRRHLGERGLIRLFLAPLPEPPPGRGVEAK